MASELEHPESLDNINSLKASDELRDFVTSLHKDVEEARNDRNDWEQRQDDYTRKRYGIRQKKSFPWVGAANFVLPQIDSDINRLKPSYVNLAFGVSPIVNFEPYGPEDIEPAKKRECLFDWRMRTQVRFFKENCLGIDYMLQTGYKVYKIYWKYQTRKYTKFLDLSEVDANVVDALFMPEVTDDVLLQVIAEQMRPDMTIQENVDAIKSAIEEFREGKTKFEMEFVEKAENRPEVKACNPRNDISFPIGTTDIQQAQHIDYRFWISKNDLKIAMENGKYDEFSDDEIDGWSTKSYQLSTADTLKAVRDGVVMDKRNDELILCHEVCSWYDIDGDGIQERVITTYPDSSPSSLLRFIEVPYDHGQFPYVVVRREFNDAEIMSSRGIPALDDDFQTGISTLFNQDIDAGTITNTPTVVARRNSVKNLRNLRYIPGQVVETENGAADYQVVQNQNLGQGGRFNNMQYLKAWANDRIGSLTAATSQINNKPGAGQQGQKTATEVSEISSAAGQLQAMDLQVYQQQMQDVYYQIDALYEQFGDDETTFMITNEKPVHMTRQEIQGKFNMVPNGRLDNSNPVLRSNKALAIYDRFSQNPYVKPYELTKMTLDELDYKVSKLILKSPEQMQQEQAQQEQMKAQMESSELQKQLGIRKISDALELKQAADMAKIGAKVGVTTVQKSDGI